MYYKAGIKEKILTVRISSELMEKLDKTASRLGVTRSELAKRALEKTVLEVKDSPNDEIKSATSLMAKGKSYKISRQDLKELLNTLRDSPPVHKNLNQAMRFLRGRDWQED